VAMMQNPDFQNTIEGLGLEIWTALAVHPFLRAISFYPKARPT